MRSGGGSVMCRSRMNALRGGSGRPRTPPCTATNEAAREFLSEQQVEEKELPDCRGDNPQQIVFLENDSELTDPLPRQDAYDVLFDENRDGDTQYCDKVLRWLLDLMRRLSRVGMGGDFT